MKQSILLSIFVDAAKVVHHITNKLSLAQTEHYKPELVIKITRYDFNCKYFQKNYNFGNNFTKSTLICQIIVLIVFIVLYTLRCSWWRSAQSGHNQPLLEFFNAYFIVRNESVQIHFSPKLGENTLTRITLSRILLEIPESSGKI
jgi:hypothetical protein